MTVRVRGPRVWIPVLGPIGAWIVHLVVDSSISRLACNAHRYEWLQHAVTAATALVVIVCMALAVGLVRAGRGATDEEGTPSGQALFLGVFALFLGAVNLALILLEGTYLVVIHACT
jgi:hypothetical protein